MRVPHPLSTVLYVDDDHTILNIATMALTAIGKFKVKTCSTGVDALEVIASGFMPDIILLDVNMPSLDGPATLAQLRHLPQTLKTPVVFMTAETDSEKLDHLKSLGVLGIIAKPFQPTKLPQLVMDIWNQQHSTPTTHPTNLLSQQLHVEYLEQLQEQYLTLKELRYKIIEENIDSESYQQLKFLAHKIAGAGSAFGFPAISQAAKHVVTAKSSETTLSALIILMNLCTTILDTNS
ncbi:MAG: response regulator [Pseudomonadota bacterium]